MSFPDTWGPYFFASITNISGVEYSIASLIDLTTLETPEGDFPGEGLPNAAGGRQWKDAPQEDGEVSFEIWARELDKTQGLFQLFYGSDETTDPLTTGTAITAGVTRTRDRFMLTILFTNDGALGHPTGAVGTASEALRFTARNCRMITHKPTMTDGILKIPVTFKYPAAPKAGNARNVRWDSTDSSAGLGSAVYP